MATLLQTFESGTNGVTPTTANSAGGGEPIAVGSASGGTVVYSNSNPIEGTLSALWTAPSGAIARVQMTTPAVKTVGTFTKHRLNSATSAQQFHGLRNSTTRMATVTLNANGTVKLSSNNADLYTTPSALSLPGQYWVDLAGDAGTSTTDGRVRFALFDSAGNFAGGMTGYVEYTGRNIGGGTVASTLWVGALDTPAVARSGMVDTIRVIDSYGPALPPVAPPATPPTANAGPDQANVEPYTTVTLDGTGSTPGTNPITSYSWGAPSPAGPTLTNPTSSTPTLYLPAKVAAQTYTVPLTVSDGTLTSTDTVDIGVLPATDTTWQADGTEVPFQWVGL